MKTSNFTYYLVKYFSLISILLLVFQISNGQQQIEFIGLAEDGEGSAAWNADGSGPEPAAMGHINPNTGSASLYYIASRDYITQNPEDALATFQDGIIGFPQFAQALTNNGFEPDNVKMKFGLGSYEGDVEGLDWFNMAGQEYYANHYGIDLTFELDGEPLLAGYLSYSNHHRTGSNEYWYNETAYTNLVNIAEGNTAEVIADAFLSDLNGKEISLTFESTIEEYMPVSNGRNGVYINILNGMIIVGNPTIPFQGLNADHEGMAAWDADGTGPEPFGNGHLSKKYYVASRDYNDIDPDPEACLGHFLDGSTGFLNTLLQLQYRGFEIGDLKLKYDLTSLGPDVFEEDWGYENGNHWANFYNNNFTFELNGEPIMAMMADTNKTILYAEWSGSTSISIVKNISQGASTGAQYVAQSFMKDMGTHYLKANAFEIVFAQNLVGNGRFGFMADVIPANIIAVHEQATFISEGTVSGTWTAENAPYYIDGHVTVENGQTLEIEPGVRIAVREPYHFEIQGCIQAEGTAENPIMFTASNPNIYWDGLDFDNTPAENEPSIFDHCLFRYAYAQGLPPETSGGAFAIQNYSDISITNSTFEFNKADINVPPYTPSGGAIAISNGDPLIESCIFRNNQAEDAAAIVLYDNSNPVISNCLFQDNIALSDAGVIEFNTNCNGTIFNNTFVNNQAANGGAIQVKTNSNPGFYNNIFWGNEATNSGDQVHIADGASQPGFYYCDIEGGQENFGGIPFTGDYLYNIGDDPLFAGIGDHPYALSLESPCIDAAWPADWHMIPQWDIIGNQRITDGNGDGSSKIDMGAYEFTSTSFMILGDDPGWRDSKNPLQIYPNPATTMIHLNENLLDHQNAKIEIFNFLGQKMMEQSVIGNSGHDISINISNLKSGIYYCTLRENNISYTSKFIKQ
ncbi:MAG: T9SS type A sorting domain-containing protein [Bacteroidetes bacterium]|nr:T9SS type A sorting domain-containing protein [Bacteroidota bacterium]